MPSKKVAKRRVVHPAVKYSPEAAEYICACMAEGQSMANIFRRDVHIHPFTGDEVSNFPKDIRSHYRWVRKFPEYREMIKQAEEDRADYYVERIHDLMERVESGSLGVSQARFSADQIKWIACKMKPKKYSDEAVRSIGKTDEKLKVEFNFVLGDEKSQKNVQLINSRVVEAEDILELESEEASLLSEDE